MFEVEFPRKGLQFKRLGSSVFNTAVVPVQSGQEQRNRAWQNPRRQYSGSLILTGEPNTPHNIAIYSAVEAFFLLVAGQWDSFRFYDELDCQATGEPMVVIAGTSNTQWQLQRTYSLGGRSYTRAITKPIGPPAVDYQGNAFAGTVTVHPSGGTVSLIDYTTGIVNFSVAPVGTPTADFQYHIPVRFTSDKFEPQIDPSAPGSRLIRWNSLAMIEVRPPNY